MSSGQISRDGAFLLLKTSTYLLLFLSSSEPSERNEEKTRKRSYGTRD